ncbi:MAG: glycoside hydrolase family 16 protein [Pirellulales bacterium]|nr:glycoside hydrolase family 16 protein [Pirellulales bacterium]
MSSRICKRLVLTLSLCAAHFFAAQSLLAESPQWTLVWSDEFDSPGAPDPKKWGYEQGFVRNQEHQFYTRDRRENARVENGTLVIEARKERWRNPDYRARLANRRGDTPSREYADYTSASITTLGKARWTYGRIEVRAQLPEGKGVWPAIWTLGENIRQVGWPRCGELDIMEFVGFKPLTIHANIHCSKYNHAQGTAQGAELELPAAPSKHYHIYAMEWFEDRIDFFLDDRKYFTFKNEGTGSAAWPYDKPQYLLLNLAIGGTWGAQQGIDDSIFPQRFLVDYVRVYQQAP